MSTSAAQDAAGPGGPGTSAPPSGARRTRRWLLVGGGRYVEDVHLPGLVHLAVVRSPHAHARVAGIDGRPALALPGVIAVLGVREAPELGLGVPPLIAETAFRPYVHPVMARDRVRHVGEAVAVVVAEDPYRAADAADLVAVDYEPLPAAAGPVIPPAPAAVVHDGWPDNLAGSTRSAVGDVASGFARAHVTAEVRVRYPRVTGMPIETRGVLAAPDPVSGRITVWTSTQVPFNVRAAIASVLEVPEDSIRVIAPDVGGGFGIKGHVYPEDVMIPAVARRLGRPVRWIETRREHLLTASGDRDQTHRARIGVDGEGAIVAIETTFVRDHGAFPTLGDAITRNTINHLVGPYRVPSYRALGHNVVTHKTFAAAYRGAGRPEAAFVLDRLLDRAARRLGMDPAELRRRNLVRAGEMPFATGLVYRDGVPISYDPGDYVAAFDETLRALDYAGWRKEQAARRGGPRPIGIGVCAYVEGTGLGPVRGSRGQGGPRRGRVRRYRGVGPGAGPRDRPWPRSRPISSLSPIEAVVVRGGRHRPRRLRHGHHREPRGRRGRAGGGALRPGGRQEGAPGGGRGLRVRAGRRACSPTAMPSCAGLRTGGFALGDLARAAVRSRAAARQAGRPGLGACVFFYSRPASRGPSASRRRWSRSTSRPAPSILKLAVVHDCGRPINPLIVEGQLHGGVAQGIGSALMERSVYDESGQLLTGALTEYAIPRPADVPAIDLRPRRVPLRRQRARDQGRRRERRDRPGRGGRERGRGRPGRVRCRGSTRFPVAGIVPASSCSPPPGAGPAPAPGLR